jgi:hypothetical protein
MCLTTPQSCGICNAKSSHKLYLASKASCASRLRRIPAVQWMRLNKCALKDTAACRRGVKWTTPRTAALAPAWGRVIACVAHSFFVCAVAGSLRIASPAKAAWRGRVTVRLADLVETRLEGHRQPRPPPRRTLQTLATANCRPCQIESARRIAICSTPARESPEL